MLLKFFSRLAGLRKPMFNPGNLYDYAEVLSWFHPECTPAQHVVLRIVKGGQETHYLSFAPKRLEVWSTRSYFQTRHGIEAAFINSYEDELLLQGFRNAWPAIKSELNTQQLSLIKNDSIKKVSDYEILQIARDLSDAKKAELRDRGKPGEVIQLRSLDLHAMSKKVESFTSAEGRTTWASWAGTCFHEKDTYNCAAMVLEVLYAGGLSDLISSKNDLLGELGLLIGAGYFVFQNSQNWLDAVIDLGVGFAAGRCLGGIYEGYTGIQTYLDVISAQGKDNIFSVLGLRLLSTSLAAVIGTLKPGIVVPAVLALPRDTLNLAHQAKIEEEDGFTYRFRK